jgi:NitT/TauT family transport system permease protein
MTGIFKKIFLALALIALWALIWEMACWRKDEFIFPRPWPVLLALKDGLLGGEFLRALGVSLWRLLTGYCFALALGVVLGLLLAYTRFFAWLLGPLVLGIQSLPSICWIPVAIIVFGLAPAAILFVIVMGSLGSIAMATVDGLRQVPVAYQRVAGTFGANFRQRLLWVDIPAALPMFISGLKQGWSFAWRSLLAGELICHGAGIGFGIGGLLDEARNLADYTRVAALMIVLVCVSVLVDRFVFRRLEICVNQRCGQTEKR